MSADLSGYTFTNGTKVTDWIASLPADDRVRAAKVVEDFVAERKPLNMLQVKIRLTAPPTDSDPDLDDEIRKTESVTDPAKVTASHNADDAYNSPGPIRPTAEPATPVKPTGNNGKWTFSKMLLVVAGILFAIAILTNPSRETHVRTLTESVARATARSIGQDMEMDMFGDIFGFGQPRITDDVIESMVYDVLNAQLKYHNYFLFSTCTAPVGYDEPTVSVGAFGMVRATEDNLTVN